MKTPLGILCSFSFLTILLKASILNVPKNIESTSIYAYYISDKSELICTDKPLDLSQLTSGTLKFSPKPSTNEFDCLIPVKDDSFEDVTIHIQTLYSAEHSPPARKLLNAKIFGNLVMYNVDLDQANTKAVQKKILLKIASGKVYDSKKPSVCILSEEGCEFREIKGSSLFLDQFIKLNLFTTEKHIEENSPPGVTPMSMIATKIYYPNTCLPTCVKGVCYNESCLCRNGYSGEDCSVRK